MKKLIIAAVCAAILAAPAAFSQDKPAKSTATTNTAMKGEKMKGKHGKHHVMAKKTEVKKTEKKSSQ
ncbi:hypothetical protein [Larkinella rosea]|uniref:Pentapeptide MXKDX repeat protein n=1 Tax=Larkinella rosea TaxID=2025312 RepID=A0A3P1BIC8_9BACT|nr:hypothetical protein [Larkinella rosea]RRB00735.1 hypothetical protein EHT25_21295 [Larkinella rosea]